jgi:hypothetical protein
MTYTIPIMDDPLGKYWEQPADIRQALMDDTHVILTLRQIEQLKEYSSTMPTGVYPGKCWQRKERDPDRHLLVWYGDENNEGKCPILFREILVMRPGP